MAGGIGPTAVDVALSNGLSAMARFSADASASNTSALDEAISTLIRALSKVDSTARLSPNNQILIEFLQYCPSILSSNTTAATTRSRLHRLLFNIALFNVRLRRYLAGQLELCGPVYHCLALSLREQLGPQNMIDILRLLQVLTYEKCLVLAVWTNDLITFLIAEINRTPEEEWLPYCMAIICNLASRSKSVCNRIKKSSSYKQFSKTVVRLLSHDSRVVVVSALVLVGYLEEKVRDMVFCSQNIHETFQCVWNVLIMGDGDCLMTRHIASDLLRRLIISDAPSVCSTPVITSTGRDVALFPFFARCIQQTSELLVSLDPRLEESQKIYDLLVSLCSLAQLRSPICSAIIKVSPTESRLTTPLLAVTLHASMSNEEAVDPQVPIRAMSLLTLLLKEVSDSGRTLNSFVPREDLLRILDKSLKTSVDTSGENALVQCQRVVAGLRLAEVCSQDEELRPEVVELASAAFCSHLAAFQLLTNPVVVHMGKPPLQRTEKLPDWSMHGVSIVLELIRLLAALKDFSKPHKVQYWNSLKDERLVPFLAFAIAHGDHAMVYEALTLYNHCTQVQEFPSRCAISCEGLTESYENILVLLLGDLVASCSIGRQTTVPNRPNSSLNSSKDNRRSPEEMDMSFPNARTPSPALMTSQQKESAKAVSELLGRMRQGMEVKDARMSDYITAFEAKIKYLENREIELEKLVAVKDQAIAQSEKLRHASKAACGSSDVELSKIRSLVSEIETLKEENTRRQAQVEATRNSMQDKVDKLRDELIKARCEKEEMENEIADERLLVQSARQLSDDLKKKLQIASSAVETKQGEVELLQKDKAALNDMLSRTNADVSALQRETRRLSEELNGVQSKLDVRENDFTTLQEECRGLQSKLILKERDCQKIQAELNGLRSHGQKTQADLERLQRVREEVLRIAADM